MVYPGRPIYHTNVFLAIGTNWVVVCLEVNLVSILALLLTVHLGKSSGKKAVNSVDMNCAGSAGGGQEETGKITRREGGKVAAAQ